MLIQNYYIDTSPILHALRHGQTSSISRQALKDITGYSDRRIRHEIERLRVKGIPICSNSQNKGYYIAEKQEEVKHFVSEQRHRAVKMLKIAEKVENGYFNQNQIQI